MARASSGQVAQRRARVFAGIVAGKTLAAIAAQEDVSDTTITGDVRAITAKLETHAGGELKTVLASAIATYQRVIDEAWKGYDEAWAIMQRWLAGDYDRVELFPQPDGGDMREVRKPPVLKLEMATYLDKILAATKALTKMAGVEGAEKVQVQGDEAKPLTIRVVYDAPHSQSPDER